MFSRILLLSSKVTLFLSIVALAASPRTALAVFSDVEQTSEYFVSIEYVRNQSIVQGYPDGTFRPNNTINRAEFIKIIVNAFAKSGGSHCFADIRDEWFAPYVCGAKEQNIISGYADGTFKPEQNISFAEASKILSVALQLPRFPPGETWYEPFIRALSDAHAIPVSIADPSQLLLRGEMAEMIYRLHAHVTDREYSYYDGSFSRVSVPSLVLATSPARRSNDEDKPSSYIFPLGENWKDDWRFYIDTVSPPIPAKEGANLLASLDLDRVQRVTDNNTDKFSEFIRVHFPKGAGSFFAAHFYNKPRAGVIAYALGNIVPSDSMHLSYYVRFPKGFDFSVGGVLPSLGGAITTSNYGAFGSIFSAGVSWNTFGAIRVSGNFDTASEDIRSTEGKFFDDDQWHRVDIVARMNTVPARRFNGELIVKYDGETIFQRDDVRFRSRLEDRWDSLAFYATIGSLDVFSVAPNDMYVHLAEFRIESE